jgi:hypothetical protein
MSWDISPPSREEDKDDLSWTFEAWDWMLWQELGLPHRTPSWVDLPRCCASCIVHRTSGAASTTRPDPYNFLFCPLIDPVAGYRLPLPHADHRIYEGPKELGRTPTRDRPLPKNEKQLNRLSLPRVGTNPRGVFSY